MARWQRWQGGRRPASLPLAPSCSLCLARHPVSFLTSLVPAPKCVHGLTMKHSLIEPELFLIGWRTHYMHRGLTRLTMFALIASGGGETVIDLGFTSTGGAGLRPQLLPRTGDQVDSWEVSFPVIQPCHQTHVYQLIHCCVSIIQP